MANENLAKAADLLRSGKLVAIPTETVYGLAADARNPDAVARIFEVKQRPAFDPLIIHLASADEASEYVQGLGPRFQKLYAAFSPGPLTYILPKTAAVPDMVTAGHSTVALRFPNHPLTRQLLQDIEFPLAAPSANMFGRVSPVTAQHVKDQLGHKIEMILDGGPCQVGLESTIIDLSKNKLEVLRLGGLALEEIESVLGEKISAVKTSSSNPKAPGMLSAHYSPGIKLLHGNVCENLKLINPARTGSISFCQKIKGIPKPNQRVLSPRCDMREAAASLFSALRSFSKTDIDVILAEHFPEEGLGRAINDRLKRASVK